MATLKWTSNHVSSEEHLVLKAKEGLQLGEPYIAKSWMITAKTLYPNNFGIQFEAYLIEKSAKNVKEAAKCFGSIFQKFQDHGECVLLWQEVQSVTSALRSDSGEPEVEFLRDMFTYIPTKVQRDLLLLTAERSEDTMEHCRLLLVLLNRFPEAVSEHGPRLVDTLLTAEKHCHYQNAVNCYRKLLVCDLLPLLGTYQVEMQSKQWIRLLHKSIEFFLCYLSLTNKLIENLPECESCIEDPWKNLFKILEYTAKKLGWELNCSVFGITCNKDVWLQTLTDFKVSSNEEQLLYCTVTCFLHCLHEYRTAVGGEAPLVLVEIFNDVDEKKEPDTKISRADNDLSTVTLTFAKDGSGGSSIVNSFVLGVRCWSILHRTEAMEREFLKLCKQLKLESWFGNFLVDAALYAGQYDNAYIQELQSQDVSCHGILARNLRLATINFSLHKHSHVVENVFQILAVIQNLTYIGSSSGPRVKQLKKHLHFLPLGRTPVLQYCVTLLIATLKKSRNSDLATGHLLVLSQLDWPADEDLACHLIEQIRLRGSFSYNLFQQYIINIDLLEEFMFLSTELGGNIQLDIMPSSAQLANQRRVSTRGTDKGVKEDFKLAMRRQAARSYEQIDTLITKFLMYEKDVLLQALETC